MMVVRMRINRIPKTDRATTRQRRLFLDTLGEAKGPMDARELYHRVMEKDPRISLATVYRNLRLFKELGVVDERRLDEAHCYYEIKGSTEHYHMVCIACGRVVEFESPQVSDLVREVQRNSDFDVTRAVPYLEGYCPKCKDKGKAH